MTKKKQSTEISKKVDDLKQYDLNVKNYIECLDKKLTIPPDCIEAEYHTSVMIDNIGFMIRIKKKQVSNTSNPRQLFYLYIQIRGYIFKY